MAEILGTYFVFGTVSYKHVTTFMNPKYPFISLLDLFVYLQLVCNFSLRYEKSSLRILEI